MITVLLGNPRGTIAPELYGTLLEDYGRTIYDGVWVGDGGPIPNKSGCRLDTIEAFRELGMSVIRFPGGATADYYRWRDGIGPRSKRPRTWNYYQGGEDTNEFGTDEYLQFCESVGADACIKLNPISAPLHEALDWMQYCNYKGTTALATLRRQNGHPEPYSVKSWIIGNECADAWSPEAFAERVHQWAFLMRQVDPKAKIIATAWDHAWNARFLKRYAQLATGGGPMASNPVGLVGDSDIQPGRMIHMLGLKYPSEETIQKTIALLDGYLGPATVDICVEEWCAMANVNDTWPEIDFIYPEEWASMSFPERILMQGQSNLTYEVAAKLDNALVTAEQLHLFMRYANRIKMAGFIFPTNAWVPLIKTAGPTLIRTPNYYVFQMLKGHLRAEAIGVELEDGEGIDVMASLTKDGGQLTVSMLNKQKDRPPVDARLRVKDYEGRSLKAARAMVLSGSSTDENTVEAPNRVRPQQAKVGIKDDQLSVTCKPLSLTVVTCELAR